jgi:hypothetical protein
MSGMKRKQMTQQPPVSCKRPKITTLSTSHLSTWLCSFPTVICDVVFEYAKESCIVDFETFTDRYEPRLEHLIQQPNYLDRMRDIKVFVHELLSEWMELDCALNRMSCDVLFDDIVKTEQFLLENCTTTAVEELVFTFADSKYLFDPFTTMQYWTKNLNSIFYGSNTLAEVGVNASYSSSPTLVALTSCVDQRARNNGKLDIMGAIFMRQWHKRGLMWFLFMCLWAHRALTHLTPGTGAPSNLNQENVDMLEFTLEKYNRP